MITVVHLAMAENLHKDSSSLPGCRGPASFSLNSRIIDLTSLLVAFMETSERGPFGRRSVNAVGAL